MQSARASAVGAAAEGLRLSESLVRYSSSRHRQARASHAPNQALAAPAAPAGASTRLTPGFLPALMSGGSVELTMYTPGAWWLKGDISWAFFLAYFRRIFGFLRYGRSYACFLGCPPVFRSSATKRWRGDQDWRFSPAQQNFCPQVYSIEQ